jgi:uncharacterized protein YeaC (DUF1315 family)
MNFSDLINSITPEIYQNLKRAVEIGKWPNGDKLTDEQREHCMQAMIAFEQKHLPPESRTGYVPPKDACASTKPNDGSEKIKWQ